MQSYIPLEYDRSHLEIRKMDLQYGSLIDYFDLGLLLFNMLAIIAIAAYYFLTPKKIKQQIILKVPQKSAHDIPHFTYNRHGKKPKLKDLKEAKELNQLNPHTQMMGYNLVELKCMKCTHSTEVFELKGAEKQ